MFSGLTLCGQAVFLEVVHWDPTSTPSGRSIACASSELLLPTWSFQLAWPLGVKSSSEIVLMWNLLTASTATVSSHIIWIHGNWVLFCKYTAIFCVYLTPMDQLLNFANNHGLFSQLSHFFLTQLNKENWETWQSWKRILSWWKRAVKLVGNHSQRFYYGVIWFEPAPQKRFIQGSLPISALQYTQ